MKTKMNIKLLIKRLVYRHRADSESYKRYLLKKGVTIGERVCFFSPKTTEVDVTRPWLVTIGNDVQITHGVTILTHGYDWSVLKRVYGDILGSSGRVSIGDNVFVGVNTTILKGSHIGNNVIIGAGSVVTGDIADNSVAVGNPCRVVMSLDDYYKKRKKAQVMEAKELVRYYRKKYNKEPDDIALHEFFWLFSDGKSVLTEKWKSMMKLVGNENMSYKKLSDNKKEYEDMSSFLESVNQDDD